MRAGSWGRENTNYYSLRKIHLFVDPKALNMLEHNICFWV